MKIIDNNDDRENSRLDRYCAALFISQIGWPKGFHTETTNATITFVEYKQKIYGITCRHVVNALKMEHCNLSEFMFTLTSNDLFFYIARINSTNDGLANPITPVDLKEFCQQDPDIAIFEFTDFDLYSHFSHKKPFKLEKDFDFSANIENMAIAVGYPTKIKHRVGQFKMVSPVIEIIAHYNDKSVYPRITISDTLEQEVPDCSGMSGGPMFIKMNGELSLVGIVCEQLFIAKAEKNQAIVTAESLTIERFERWIEHALVGNLSLFKALN